MRRAMVDHNVNVPDDFGMIFKSADMGGAGRMDYVNFVATAIVNEPTLVCGDVMLRAAFRFLDAKDNGVITDDVVGSIFDLPVCSAAGLVRESCRSDIMVFASFRQMMVPEGWDGEFLRSINAEPAPWANAPDAAYNSSQTSVALEAWVNPVKSAPSKSFAICQKPGFYSQALRQFYASQPISNVVLGLVRGTSSYARKSVALGLADVIEVGNGNGAFFIMPNPKYHWEPTRAACTTDSPFRFVAWWIHPDFLDELQSWVGNRIGMSHDTCPFPGKEDASIGSPGDFRYSDVQKPPCGYLHTYRDLAGARHLEMLEATVSGIGKFLERLLGSTLPHARLKAGFHFPVRPQYSTLHLQLRVNSGDVCGGPENRGADLFHLLAQLRTNPDTFSLDSETLHYQATSNLREALLVAAASSNQTIQEVGPQSLVLG